MLARRPCAARVAHTPMVSNRSRSGMMPRLHAPSRSNRHYTVTNLSDDFKEAKVKIAKTYGYVASNLATTAVSAAVCYQTGIADSVLSLIGNHPMSGTLGIIVLSSAQLAATLRFNESESPKLKKTALTMFNATMGSILSPFGFLGGEVLCSAGVITIGATGALAAAALKAKDEIQLKYATPLNVGLGAVATASVCALAFPGTIGGLGYAASLYGGLALFSGLLASDIQQLHLRAGDKDFSPIDQSLIIYLDILNIFERVAALLDRPKTNLEPIKEGLTTTSESVVNQRSLELAVQEKLAQERKNDASTLVTEDYIHHNIYYRHPETSKTSFMDDGQTSSRMSVSDFSHPSSSSNDGGGSDCGGGDDGGD